MIKLRCPRCWAVFETEDKSMVESPCCGVALDMPAELENIRRGQDIAPRFEGL